MLKEKIILCTSLKESNFFLKLSVIIFRKILSCSMRG